jgi:hypothetical protein
MSMASETTCKVCKKPLEVGKYLTVDASGPPLETPVVFKLCPTCAPTFLSGWGIANPALKTPPRTPPKKSEGRRTSTF